MWPNFKPAYFAFARKAKAHLMHVFSNINTTNCTVSPLPYPLLNASANITWHKAKESQRHVLEMPQ